MKNVEDKYEPKDCQLRLRVTEKMKKQITELAEEMNISQTQVIENAFMLYYSQDVMAEDIILGRMTQIQHQLTTLDRKVETLCGLLYTCLPYIFGTLPDLPKNVTNSDGTKFNPGYVKGHDVLEKLVKIYKKDWKTHKISFVQNIWADMQEEIEMSNMEAPKGGNEPDRSN